MWRELVQKPGWSQLRDFVSPSFFDVMRAGDLRRQLRELAGNAVRRADFSRVREALQAELDAANLPIRLGAAPAPAEPDASARGSAVLGLFFRQLFGSDTAVLDLRHGRFGERGGHHYWQPRPLYVTWDPGFLSALRQVYLGFYGDRPAQLHEGLDQLGIACAQTVFTKHFQYPDQHAVRFRLGDFRSGFHDAFLRCREARAHLHPNFVALGVYLACLYEHLEWLGGTHDVATAFRTQALR